MLVISHSIRWIFNPVSLIFFSNVILDAGPGNTDRLLYSDTSRCYYSFWFWSSYCTFLLGFPTTLIEVGIMDIYIFWLVCIQGNTVASMGSFKGLKLVRRIVEDCIENKMHPIFHIKVITLLLCDLPRLPFHFTKLQVSPEDLWMDQS